MRPIIPAVSSAIRLEARRRRSRSSRDLGWTCVTLTGCPVSGDGIRKTSGSSCWRSKTRLSERAAPGELRMRRRIVDPLALEPQLAPVAAQAGEELRSGSCARCRLRCDPQHLGRSMGYSYPNAARRAASLSSPGAGPASARRPRAALPRRERRSSSRAGGRSRSRLLADDIGAIAVAGDASSAEDSRRAVEAAVEQLRRARHPRRERGRRGNAGGGGDGRRGLARRDRLEPRRAASSTCPRGTPGAARPRRRLDRRRGLGRRARGAPVAGRLHGGQDRA